MKRLMYILLAGLTIVGLASCEKQELKPSSVNEVYAVEIEGVDPLTKGDSSFEIENGSSRTFYATLKKSSDGGNTWTYVSHSNWTWGNITNCSKGNPSTELNHKASGVVSGCCVYTGENVSLKNLTVQANSTPAGTLSQQVAVDVKARKKTVTFKFTPNESNLLSIMQSKFGTTSGCTGKASVSCPIEVTDGSGNALGSTSFAAFYQYTVPSKLESIKSMSSAAKPVDERVLKLEVKIDEGKKLVFKFKEAGKIYFPDNDNRTNQKISVSQGSSTYASGYYAAYQISAVNSDLTINVTTPN